MFEEWTCLHTLTLVVVAVSLLVLYFYKKFRYWKDRNVFYFKPKPLFGNFYKVATFKENVGIHLAKLYSSTTEPFFGMYVFTLPYLIVRSPELIRQIVVKDFQYFSDRSIFVDEHDTISKNMLFTNKNPEWKVIRTKMTPVFTSGKLKTMIPLINTVGEAMKHYIRTQIVDKDSEDIKEICAQYATDVITRCAFGINAHSFDSEDAEFRKAGKLIFNFDPSNAIQQLSTFFCPPLVKLLRFKLFNDKAAKFMRNAFWNIIKEREASGVKGNDLIDLIVDMRKNQKLIDEFDFKNDKVVSQAVQFFAAGFETTSSTMAYVLYQLCLNPEMQKKVRAEIKQTLVDEGEFTYENVHKMKYLHMVVSEVLRMYPVLPFLDRSCLSDYKIPGTDVVIEKGIPVYIPILGLHMDPKYFPDPHVFDPERFSDERINDISPFSYLPFGEGPRSCIGERFGMFSTKLGVVHILSEFEVVMSADTPVDLKYQTKTFLLSPECGLPMKIKKP